MAKIYPFRSLKYAPDKAPLDKVVTQPYDKISPEMQDRYYAAHPNNIVRIIFGKSEPTDSSENSVYTRATAYLKEWRTNGILQQLPEPAIFIYFQKFTVPDQKELRTRKGFVALGQLEDYANKVVFPHERTLTGSKKDRMPMTFCNMSSPGLTILPTHRVLANLPGFDAKNFLSRAADLFDLTEAPTSSRITIGAFADGRLTFLRLKGGLDLNALLPDLS